MAAFHFALPSIFDWDRFASALPTPIRWALFAINAFFSMLLLAGGLASVGLARRQRPATAVLWIMVLFWAFSAGYQMLRPFPMAGIRWVLLGFALATSALYALTLWALGRAGQTIRAPGAV
jgi:hypothetical protein